MTAARTKRLTFEEWQALPETKQRCEVLDGALLMPPSPTDEHQWIGFTIASRVSGFVAGRALGIVLTAPRDVLIRRDPLRIRQPDALYLSAARAGVSRPSDLVGRPRIEAPVDLVIEVVSPSNTPRDIEERVADYRSIGVPECWLASFADRTVLVLSLTPDGVDTIGTYGVGDTLVSEVLRGFKLPIDDIFGPLLGQEATR